MFEDNGSNPEMYLEYKEVLYDLAVTYNCALVDFDKAWGGYYNAVANGLIDDGTHPNAKGNDIMTDIITDVLSPNALPFRTFKINHGSNVTNYYDLLIEYSGVLGRIIYDNDSYFRKVLRGINANGDEQPLKVSKVDIVDEAGNILGQMGHFGSFGEIMLMRDKYNPTNQMQYYSAYNNSYIKAGNGVHFDTIDTAKRITHPTRFFNRVQAEKGISLAAIAVNEAQPNTLFIDSADGLLKFKQGSGAPKSVSLN